MKSRIYKKWWIWGVVVVLVIGGWFLFGSEKNPSYDSDKKQSDLYQKELSSWVEKQKQDTYGGDTPQETWDMFVSALKKGDVDLASKYFVVEKQEEWKDNMLSIKNGNVLPKMINDLVNNYKVLGLTKADDFRYIKKNKNGIVVAEIVLILNKYTNIWKIESL